MSARRQRVEEEEEHVNHERWLITYADMITLLMVLFIVLFAIGQTDLAKFKQLKQGLDRSYGGKGGTPVLPGGSGALSGSPSLVSSVIDKKAAVALQEKDRQAAVVQAERRTLTTAQSTIQQALDVKGLGHAVRFDMTPRGLVVTIVTDQVLYDTGSAVLQPKGRAILDAVAPSLAKLPNEVAIEGHTDDQPVVSGPYPTNWELSTARATSVLRCLVESLHVAPTSVSAAGYGAERPLVPNTSDANRSLNRRVAIVILYDLSATQGAPS